MLAPIAISQPRFGQSVFQSAPSSAEHLKALEAGKRAPDKNGITKMDINPLLDQSDWFRIDENYTEQIARKKVLLQNHRDAVSAMLPEGENGAREMLEILSDYLPKTFPDKFEKNDRVLTNKLTGDVFDLDNLPDTPLAVAAQLVQEDMVFLREEPDTGKFRVTGGAVCFPSAWNLKSKIGKTLYETHVPITGLNENIEPMIKKFLSRLSPDRQFWRINFLTFQNPALTQIPGNKAFEGKSHSKPINPWNVRHMFLRSEREVFTRLPESNDIVFTLKTYQTRFKDLPPESCRQVAALLRHLPTDFIRQYKGWTPDEQQIVLRYLDRRGKADS